MAIGDFLIQSQEHEVQFLFIPKVFSVGEVRTLEFFHSIICTPCFVHSDNAMLELGKLGLTGGCDGYVSTNYWSCRIDR